MVSTGLFNAAVTGLVTGSVIALGAIGLALVYSIAEVPNFAHGEFLTLGAYMALLVNVPGTVPGLSVFADGPGSLTVPGLGILFVLVVVSVLGGVYLLGGRSALEGDWWPISVTPRAGLVGHVVIAILLALAVAVGSPSITGGMLFAALAMAAFGPVQERVVFGKFRDKGVDLATMLIVALGLSFVLRYTTQAIFGGSARRYTSPRYFTLGDVDIPLTAAQFFDLYAAASGLTLEIINTRTATGERFVTIAVAAYSWPAVAIALVATAIATVTAYRWRSGPEGFASGQTIGPRLAALVAGAVTFVVAAVLLAGDGVVPGEYTYATRVRLSLIRGGTVAIALLMMVLLHVLLKETKLGVAMRASSDNLDLAKVTGINTDRVMMATWIIAGAYAAIAGVMVGLLFAQIRPSMGFFLLLPMFAAVILGGVGSVYGAIIGAFVVGLSMDVGIFLFDLSGVHRVSMAFAVLLLVLLIKPEGIVGGS